eukprot:25038-Amphidinium_carterae.1
MLEKSASRSPCEALNGLSGTLRIEWVQDKSSRVSACSVLLSQAQSERLETLLLPWLPASHLGFATWAGAVVAIASTVASLFSCSD